PNDEYQLFWGFSFGWGSLDAKLEEGPARLRLVIDKAGEAWRQLDTVLLTDDLSFTPAGREKPNFEYQKSFSLRPKDGAAWRGSATLPSPSGRGVGGEGQQKTPLASSGREVGGEGLALAKDWQRTKLAGRDFSMWTGVEPDPKWWAKQDLTNLKPY